MEYQTYVRACRIAKMTPASEEDWLCGPVPLPELPVRKAAADYPDLPWTGVAVGRVGLEVDGHLLALHPEGALWMGRHTTTGVVIDGSVVIGEHRVPMDLIVALHEVHGQEMIATPSPVPVPSHTQALLDVWRKNWKAVPEPRAHDASDVARRAAEEQGDWTTHEGNIGLRLPSGRVLSMRGGKLWYDSQQCALDFLDGGHIASDIEVPREAIEAVYRVHGVASPPAEPPNSKWDDGDLLFNGITWISPDSICDWGSDTCRIDGERVPRAVVEYYCRRQDYEIGREGAWALDGGAFAVEGDRFVLDLADASAPVCIGGAWLRAERPLPAEYEKHRGTLTEILGDKMPEAWLTPVEIKDGKLYLRGMMVDRGSLLPQWALAHGDLFRALPQCPARWRAQLEGVALGVVLLSEIEARIRGKCYPVDGVHCWLSPDQRDSLVRQLGRTPQWMLRPYGAEIPGEVVDRHYIHLSGMRIDLRPGERYVLDDGHKWHPCDEPLPGRLHAKGGTIRKLLARCGMSLPEAWSGLPVDDKAPVPVLADNVHQWLTPMQRRELFGVGAVPAWALALHGEPIEGEQDLSPVLQVGAVQLHRANILTCLCVEGQWRDSTVPLPGDTPQQYGDLITRMFARCGMLIPEAWSGQLWTKTVVKGRHKWTRGDATIEGSARSIAINGCHLSSNAQLPPPYVPLCKDIEAFMLSLGREMPALWRDPAPTVVVDSTDTLQPLWTGGRWHSADRPLPPEALCHAEAIVAAFAAKGVALPSKWEAQLLLPSPSVSTIDTPMTTAPEVPSVTTALARVGQRSLDVGVSLAMVGAEQWALRALRTHRYGRRVRAMLFRSARAQYTAEVVAIRVLVRGIVPALAYGYGRWRGDATVAKAAIELFAAGASQTLVDVVHALSQLPEARELGMTPMQRGEAESLVQEIMGKAQETVSVPVVSEVSR